ncbi:CHAP domain-containing protein [Dictyobacter arantiisoli]|uniref:Peptidase C51 domain-containing protein n=1 Tax=Dictyobacter arantiisoli TaxID=2014874 RepID=A0A5A5T615_9CHLR|nr:CHAP domain-containing protein [Dictyobacter arantiisoli]GCF06636.1 hypothetical protein KDI_02000 [Dictyobacter arantiisoli]
MISKEYTDTSTDVEQLDFDASSHPRDEATSSRSSVEQMSMAVQGVQSAQNDDVKQKNMLPAKAEARREPVYIPATGKKSSGTMRPPKGRRHVINIGASILLIAVVLGALAAVLPAGSGEARSVLSTIFNPGVNMVASKKNDTALIAAQAATATAVTQDGYEVNGAGGQYTFAGVQNTFTLPDGTSTGSQGTTNTQTQNTNTSSAPAINSSSGGISSSTGTIADSSFNNYFTPGQCTYWADYEYHHLTGYAVTWSGNASYWAIGAANAGWNVSSTPHVPSIIVLQPGVQGAGYAGHVAVVESINANGSVATTNWNVKGWGVFSWETYSPAAGVQFVWHK